jgi:hypothetical protein
MSVYKINEITKTVTDSLKFTLPVLKLGFYFIKCGSDFYIQLDKITLKNKCYKRDDKIYCDLYFKKDIENMFIDLDNVFIERVHTMFPIWFDKKIAMEDLLEYYVPSVLIKDEPMNYFEQSDTDSENSDSSDTDSDSENDENNDGNDENENKDGNDENDDNDGNENGNDDGNDGNDENDDNIYAICEIPYDWDENDIDIMIYDSNNKLIEESWEDINLENKEGTCVMKLSGINIEKEKFYPVWEMIQLKLI